jgi:acetyltransferase-like isoleucine patch superfamily enzyme
MANNFEPIYKRYTVIEMILLILSVIRTKLLFKKARIIRFPFDVRGRKYIHIGKGFTTGKGCRFEVYPINKKVGTLIIGQDVQLNDYVHITAMQSVIIGNNVLMASKIYISDCTHGFYGDNDVHTNPNIAPINREYSVKPVEIQDNVWIGESVSILPGVVIGKGSIIGANSVVTKNIPDYVIAVGIPATPIKKYNFESNKWVKI